MDHQATVIVDHYRASADKPIGKNHYKGLRIHALRGLHEYIGARVTEYFQPQGHVVDLAAGSGAMCVRLADLGLKPLGIDYVSENFKADSIPFIQADLNTDFSALLPTSMDAIVASEIIEHLENPRHFARQCYRALRPGGRMILTTPNIQNPGSLASFIRSGRFLWFQDADYASDGHISPLSHWQIKASFEEAGFKFLKTESYGKGSTQLEGSPRLALIGKLISRMSSLDNAMAGEVFTAILERPAQKETPSVAD